MNAKNPPYQMVDALKRYADSAKGRRVKTDSGSARNIPALPYEYWCDSVGNLVQLVVMTTRNWRDPDLTGKGSINAYRDNIRSKAVRDGWFPWEYSIASRITPHLVLQHDANSWDTVRHKLQADMRSNYDNRSAAFNAKFDAAGEAQKLATKEAFSDALKDFTKALRSDVKR